MATTTESAVSRALQAHAQQLGTAFNLDWGIAYTSPRFVGLDAANQLREVIIENREDLPRAFEAVNRHFAERGVACRRWSLALDQPATEIGLFLGGRGFVRVEYRVMVVREWIDQPVPDGVRILPARAMRKALHRILTERFADQPAATRDVAIEAAIERLNDSHTDCVIAVADGEPSGYCSFHEAGDIGLLTDVYVPPSRRRWGLGAALVGNMMKMSKRLLMRVTCAAALADDAAALGLLRRCGMADDGVMIEFTAASR